jgi:hypothetical protein
MSSMRITAAAQAAPIAPVFIRGIDQKATVQMAVAWSEQFDIADPSTIEVISHAFTPPDENREGTFTASVRLPDGRTFDVTGGYSAPPFPTQWLGSATETTRRGQDGMDAAARRPLVHL